MYIALKVEENKRENIRDNKQQQTNFPFVFSSKYFVNFYFFRMDFERVGFHGQTAQRFF